MSENLVLDKETWKISSYNQFSSNKSDGSEYSRFEY